MRRTPIHGGIGRSVSAAGSVAKRARLDSAEPGIAEREDVLLPEWLDQTKNTRPDGEFMSREHGTRDCYALNDGA